MALEFLKNQKSGARFDGLVLPQGVAVSGSFLLRIQSWPVVPQIFFFLGQSTTKDSGVCIGVSSSTRGALLARVALGSQEVGLHSDVEVQPLVLDHWHRVSWALTQEDESDPEFRLWLDGRLVGKLSMPEEVLESHLWDRLGLGGRLDVFPREWAEGELADLAIWTNEEAGVVETERWTRYLLDGDRLTMQENPEGHEPYLLLPLDLESGRVQVGHGGMIDRAGSAVLAEDPDPKQVVYSASGLLPEEVVEEAPAIGSSHFRRR